MNVFFSSFCRYRIILKINNRRVNSRRNGWTFEHFIWKTVCMFFGMNLMKCYRYSNARNIFLHYTYDTKALEASKQIHFRTFTGFAWLAYMVYTTRTHSQFKTINICAGILRNTHRTPLSAQQNYIVLRKKKTRKNRQWKISSRKHCVLQCEHIGFQYCFQ